MLATVNLRILRASFRDLVDSSYLSKELDNYTRVITRIIDHVLDNPSLYNPDVLRVFVSRMWLANKYLSGSTSKEVPYELEYSLRKALAEWTGKKQFIITAAFAHDLDFHFLVVDILEQVKKIIDKFDYAGIDVACIHISFPRLYKHKPLYNIPLYHELGHFVDKEWQITNASMLTHPIKAGEDKRTIEHHRAEFFADLFAACYVGPACVEFLKTTGPGRRSDTHPSTDERVCVTNDFLNGTPNYTVQMFNDVMAKRSAPSLHPRFSSPSLTDTFGDIRPYHIGGDDELHGTFMAGWQYLKSALKRDALPWSEMGEEDVDRIINDLVEKSIRNRAIREQWANASP